MNNRQQSRKYEVGSIEGSLYGTGFSIVCNYIATFNSKGVK